MIGPKLPQSLFIHPRHHHTPLPPHPDPSRPQFPLQTADYGLCVFKTVFQGANFCAAGYPLFELSCHVTQVDAGT